jgi:hypothetical protein
MEATADKEDTVDKEATVAATMEVDTRDPTIKTINAALIKNIRRHYADILCNQAHVL